MNSNTLVLDVGQSIIGLQKPYRGRYMPYYEQKRIHAFGRLESADEIVTYNGNGYDLDELNKLSLKLRDKDFEFLGIHTDMKEIIWPGIRGSNLSGTYSLYFSSVKKFPDTYEGSNRSDVYMTLMLWRYWKSGGKFNK